MTDAAISELDDLTDCTETSLPSVLCCSYSVHTSATIGLPTSSEFTRRRSVCLYGLQLFIPLGGRKILLKGRTERGERPVQLSQKDKEQDQGADTSLVRIKIPSFVSVVSQTLLL